MEVYILDNFLRRTVVVDIYESLIWTERWTTWGDFQLDIISTPATRRLFTANTKLAINNSMYVMLVESIEDTKASDGKKTLTIKGRSLESILDSRVVRNTLSNLSVEPNWVITDTPRNVMNTMFNHVVRSATLAAGDMIPFLQPGSIMPADTNPVFDDVITWTQQPDTLYNALHSLGDTYGLGFRLLRNFDASQLYFDVYAGVDRTSGQATYTPVVFSPELDNLQNTSELVATDKEKNVAYVFSDQGFQIVYAATADSFTEGFDRKVLMVSANNLDGSPTAGEIALYLTQVGREELSKNTSVAAFDGEISQYSQYKYGVHYNLGDMVEQRNSDGVANQMRVTEQIFVNDSNGERSYPTLTTYQYVNLGSWLAWNDDRTWADLAADPQTWADQP